MTKFALIGASCEAEGHPTECQEPAPGGAVEDSQHSVTVDGTQIATEASASLSFNSHAHDYDSTDGCHNNQSHSLDPSTVSSSVTINGSPLYLVGNGVGSDPTTGGDINITDSGNNNSVEEL